MATTTQTQILLLGAKSSERPLNAIPDELSKLEHLFSRHQKINEKTGIAFGIQHHPYFTQDQLKSKLNQLQNQVAILHFAGHSDAEGILSDDKVVYSRHIAGHIKSWTIPPALVVLNGCHNAGQVKLFHDAGVSVVIATHRAVNDGLAAGFAFEFYTALLEYPKQTTLEQASDQASSNALMEENRDALPYGRSLDLEDDEQHGWDWDVFPQDEAQCESTFYELIATARPVLDKNGKLYNPYKGLEAFQEEDQSWFFGRENVTQELLSTLLPESNARQAPRFFSLLGASGSGKSSLINAGVIPKLREQSPNSIILHTRPGDDEFQELAKVLSEQLYPNTVSKQLTEGKAFAEQLHTISGILPKLMQSVLDHTKAQSIQHVYLFIDQFEELFTHLEHEQIQRFLQQLTALIESDVTCTLGISMRADFLASALAYPQFGKYINKQPHEMLSPMGETELRTAIERPAQRQQVSIESSLTENLLNDVDHQPGSLPLLQYVLSLLWEKREARQDKLIKLEDYQAFGGLEKALEQKANSVYQDLTKEQQTLCQRIFMRLVQPGDGTDDTRRRASLHEFSSETEQAVIKALVDARLITTQGKSNTITNGGKTNAQPSAYAEVSHEALIRTWSQLKEWIETNRDELRTQHKISTGSKEWIEHHQAKDWLLTGTRLSIAEEWLQKNPEQSNRDEKNFILTSSEQQKRKQLITYTFAASIFISLIIVVLVIKNQREEANKQVLKANYNLTKILEGKANSSIDKALLLESKNPSRINNLKHALLYILEAQLLPTSQGLTPINPETNYKLIQVDNRWFNQQHDISSIALNEASQSLAFSPDGNYIASANSMIVLRNRKNGDIKKEFKKGHDDLVNSIAFSPDGNLIASRACDKKIIIWDIAKEEALRTLNGHNDCINSVNYSQDGRLIVSASGDETIRIWDALSGHENWVRSAIFSPDGSLVASGSDDESVKLWDVSSGKLIHTLKGHEGWVKAVAFNPGGDLVASASNDKTVRVWKANNGQLLYILEGHKESVTSVAFNPNGKFIASASSDQTLQIWDAKTRKNLEILQGHSKKISAISYSPDGKSLASTSDDKTILIWRPENLNPVFRLLYEFSPAETSDVLKYLWQLRLEEFSLVRNESPSYFDEDIKFISLLEKYMSPENIEPSGSSSSYAVAMYLAHETIQSFHVGDQVKLVISWLKTKCAYRDIQQREECLAKK